MTPDHDSAVAAEITRACPLCRGTAESSLFAESNIDPRRLDTYSFASRKRPEYMHHRLWTCAACDLLYANPIPSEDVLSDAYKRAAFDAKDTARFAAATYARHLQKIRVHLSCTDGVLDIGTGEGAFLGELLSTGFTNVIGLEPSSAPLQQSDPSVRALIRQDTFRPGLFSAEQFCLITCFQTLEHVIDPLALCTEALRLLKPGGALVVIVHNRRAISAKLLGRRSPIFDVEHLQLFSHISAREMFRRAGFDNPRTHTLINTYPLNYWLRLAPLPSIIKPTAEQLLLKSGIGRLRISVAAGNIAAVGFKPNKR